MLSLSAGCGVLLAARGVGGRRGAGLRLRSGAFAPDFPVVNLVRLRLPTVSLGRIYTPRAPPAADATGYSVITSPARGRIVCLAFWRQTGSGRKIWRGRQNRPRGRPSLAFGERSGEMRRNRRGNAGGTTFGRIRDASGVVFRGKDPRCIRRCLPWKGSAMHRQTSSLSAVLPQYQARAKPVTRKPSSIARRHSLPPDWTAPQASNPPPARSVNTPSQDTA
ncbi:hypothetical protein LMG3328_02941 [Achromobacter ruhlandii]|uniref:Uncharacterized protein n=1 Tax=Achromobacter ruhlandii TaxID=72557 RepID=A0A6S7D1B7_9BURK|nr:hypothetical protein LMG3328_02941 [Achromobacter ruhlandii]